MITYKYHLTIGFKVIPKRWSKIRAFETVITHSEKLSKEQLREFIHRQSESIKVDVNGFIMKPIRSTIEIIKIKQGRDYS